MFHPENENGPAYYRVKRGDGSSVSPGWNKAWNAGTVRRNLVKTRRFWRFTGIETEATLVLVWNGYCEWSVE
jgi:hypothetical protein